MAIIGIAGKTCAGPPAKLPPDDPKVVKAIVKLGVSMQWGAGDNVWKVECRGGKPLTDAELEHVKGLHHLEILDLTGTKITDAGLASLEGLTLLRNLELDGTRVTDAGMIHLARLPGLKFLALNSTVVSDAGLAHLKFVKTLEGLDLNGTRVTDAGLVHIQDLPRLRFLELGHRAVESFSLVPVQKGEEPLQFHAVPNIPHPQPGAMAVSDAGLVRIARMKNLEKHVLSGSLVTDKGLAELKGLTKLEDLFLEHTQVTDAGLEHLSGMTQLKWLWLSDTQVTDAGLARLKGLKSLEMLLLENTKVTNAGLVHLQSLAKLNHLTLKGTKVTAEGIAKTFPKAGWWIEYDRPPFDWAGAEAVNSALDKVRAGDRDGFKQIVEKNPAIVNARWTQISMSDKDDNFSALHFAARKGDLPMVKLLLEHHAKVRAGDSTGNTSLHYAASKDIAAALIAAGADVNARGNCGKTPLHYACDRGVAEVLLANGADINNREHGFFPLANTPKAQGHTPLHSLAGDGRLDVVALLVERGADVNALDGETTPLYWAAVYGRTEVAELLIAKGAKVNGFDSADSPLQTAIEHNHPQVIRLLLKAGTLLPKADKQGWTVLHSAILWGCDGETIEMLLKAGASVDAKTQNEEPVSFSSDTPPDQRPPVTGRRTPLHLAAEHGNLEVAQVLIAHGAAIHAKTTDGETPLSLTRREEVYRFDPWFQGTVEMVKAWNEERRKDIEKRNANRKAIAERIRQIERESDTK